MLESASPELPEESPPQVPDLDLLCRIGEGGFGHVWLARNRTTGHLRAVKLIRLNRSGTLDAAGREISSLMRLGSQLEAHPNLLVIHHVGKTAEYLFYVMDPADDLSGAAAFFGAEYQPATLESRLAAGPLTPAECVRYAQELLQGLAALHAAGMVHRDVKPANCLLVGGVLKLADFGLLTETSPLVSRVGTRRYMPPDGHMDLRADVYAAGLVIYEMLTGLPAESFPRLGTQAETVARDADLSRLLHVVLQACQPQPQERFGDAHAMLMELNGQGAKPRRFWPRGGQLAAAALLLLGVAAVWGWWAGGPRPVHVNFITEPFEATIELDGVLLTDPSGQPVTTPCTVEHLSAQSHRVVFQHEGKTPLDLGPIDFARQRQIVGRWTLER